MRISMSTNELNTNKIDDNKTDNEEKINKKEIAGNQTDDKAINNKNDKCESKDLHINESILSEEILEDLKKNRTNHMEYMPDMEVLDSDIDKQVIEAMNNYDYDKYTAKDVENAINATNRTPEDFAALLSPAALPYLEQMAQAAKIEKERHFGNSICFFTPIYIANYCENYCDILQVSTAIIK